MFRIPSNTGIRIGSAARRRPIRGRSCRSVACFTKDFEEAWFGGSAIDVAWGQHPSGNQLDLDYDAEESIELYVVYPIRCMEDSFNTAKLPEQYRRKYWSGWDWSDIGEKISPESRIRDCS